MTSTRRRRVGPSRLLLLLLCVALGGITQVRAASLPTGGSVAAGAATIGTASNKALTVTQTSSSAVINWQSFSVAQGYTVNFVQPSATSAILNRVTGSTPSTIAGSITANGQVYLVNPNGIAITATGTVNAAAFVASTLAISDDDFMAGKRVFTGNGASAAVSNAGIITIGRGGYAALLGGSVDNAGTITVPLGKVGLGSGEQATLDLSGDGFLQVAIPTSASGSGALVSNSGTISADGGLIQLSAAAAKDLARQAINMGGIVEARSVGGTSGNIVLAGSDGAVEVSGTLTATSSEATGGAITITGRTIALEGANLDASGATGGGTIRVGGGRQGSGTLQHAETLSVDSASTIKADATVSGNGGDVVLWSDQLTTFAGTISARGGARSGDGGQAEVSGKALLAYTGLTDLSAANGSFGTLLLDPYNVTISDATSGNADTTTFTATGNDSVINAATLITALGSANVTVSTGGSGSSGSQTGNITVASALAWSSGSTLTLDAYHSIAINANITIAGSGGLVLTYGGDLTFGSGKSVSYTNADYSAATSSQGGKLTINSTVYTLLYSMADIDAIDTTGLSGHYALATSLTAGSYYHALVGTSSSAAFTGTFEGLGNTITGLTISNAYGYVGLFGHVGSGGVVRDIGLVGGSIDGGDFGVYIGGLVGYNAGTITNAYATCAVRGDSNDSNVGGLVGYNSGTISNSYATGAVIGMSYVGGLVGEINGGGVITSVYATGAVRGNTNYVGGLVGHISWGSISNAYATGAVSGSSYVGGLVGDNSGTISNAYATGAVIGSSYVGGLVGYNGIDGEISNAYATGAVSGSAYVGGLVGRNYGPIYDSYWDTETSGQSSSYGGTGLTTAQFQDGVSAAGLGSSFTVSSGLYPYLTSFFPNGVQAVSGTAYKDSGTTVLASGTSGAGLVYVRLDDGSVITTTTGANGYYYAFAAKGSIDTTSGSSVLAYTLASTGATNAATYTTKATGSLTGVNVYGSTLTETADSSVTSLSALDAAYATATSGTTASGLVLTNRTITALASGFTIDDAISIARTLVVSVPGNLTIASTGSVSAADVSLQASGAFINQSGSDAVTATNRWLIYSADSDGDTFGGLDSGNAAVWNTAAGATVSDSGNRYVFAYQPTLSVATTDASKTYGDVADVTANYTITGLSSGVTDAYEADTAASILSGAVTVSSTGSAATASVGSYSYTLDQGTLTAASGYAISLVNAGSLTVNKATLIITAANASMTYGDAVPTLSYGVSGWKNGQTDSLLTSVSVTTDASATANAGGSYTTTASGGTLSGAATGNYTITYAAGSMTVNKATLLVTAANASMTYGDAVPTLSYGVSGWKNSQTDSLLTGISVTTDASSTANAGGSYTTTASGGTLSGAASGNYTITYAAGAMTVNKATLLVTAADASMTYGDAVPTLSYGVSGWKNGQTDSLLGRVAVTTDATATSNAGGSYTTTASGGTLSGAASGNYTITYAAGSMTIATRPITVSAVAATSVYGDTPTLTYSVGGSGLVNGDALSGSLASATSASSVGVYAITQGTLANSNYNITSYTGNTLTISARPITVTANALSSYQGFAVPALTYRVGGSGLANGDTLSGALATLATSSSAVGSYAITRGSLAASANYAMTFVPGLLTVSTGAPSDTSALAPAVTRSWAVNNDWALPAAPTSPLELSFGGQGTLIFSSPDFDGLKRTPGTRL